MIYAVYRCLYGEDFIQESIKSIDPYVDKIFVFWTDKVWGNVTECQYKGQIIKFSDRWDGVVERVKELNNPKIELIYDHVENNTNQFTHLINDLILSNYKCPDQFMMIEVDHVFRKDQIEDAIIHFIMSGYESASTKAIELWRTPQYRIPERRRLGTVFWNMCSGGYKPKLDRLPNTNRQADSCTVPIQFLSEYVHNFGFCFNPKTMLLKHLTALGFSQKIGDDLPNELWYDKWLNWTVDGPLNKDLEISKGYEGNITHAYSYPFEELPEVIREKHNV